MGGMEENRLALKDFFKKLVKSRYDKGSPEENWTMEDVVKIALQIGARHTIPEAVVFLYHAFDLTVDARCRNDFFLSKREFFHQLRRLS